VSFSQIGATETVNGYSVKPGHDFVTGVGTVDDTFFGITRRAAFVTLSFPS
jgi:hypothetical protein